MMKKPKILVAICAGLGSLGILGAAEAALFPRLGGLAYYDDETNLTWLADANYAQTSGYDAGGLMTWADAKVWVVNLSVAGITGWRLPDTIDVGNDGFTYTNIYQGDDFGYNITMHSEMSNMFFNVLGNQAFYDTSGAATGCMPPPVYCITNTGSFSNLQGGTRYWSATEYAPNTNNAWFFSLADGYQAFTAKTTNYFAWAVHSGDVGDFDNDGITNSFDNCPLISNPTQIDTDSDDLGNACDDDDDNDGLTDSIEDSNGNGIVDTGETDPLNPDTDNDGLTDGNEVNFSGTDPLDFDSDDDGLTDGYEINISGTNPNTSTTLSIPGDINGDGVINVANLLLIQQQILGN